MKRPWRKRIWFYKPWPGYLVPGDGFFLPKGWWKPWGRGGDEFNWHTIYIGNPVIGMMIIATKPCNGVGSEECVEFANEFPEYYEHEWPVDSYGHNHIKCDNLDCYCKDKDDLEL